MIGGNKKLGSALNRAKDPKPLDAGARQFSRVKEHIQIRNAEVKRLPNQWAVSF